MYILSFLFLFSFFIRMWNKVWSISGEMITKKQRTTKQTKKQNCLEAFFYDAAPNPGRFSAFFCMRARKSSIFCFEAIS